MSDIVEDFVRRRISGSVKDGTAKFEWGPGYFALVNGEKVGPYGSREQAQEKLDEVRESREASLREQITEAFEKEGGFMSTQDIMAKLDEIFASYTFVRVHVSKKVQEVQFEPYEILVEQAMIVPIEDKQEAIETITGELDNQLVDLFMERGINITPQEQ